jgi:hypothetical protein
MLAERWDCTPRHVRDLIKAGKLRAFWIGNRLPRIPVDAVEEFERGEFLASASKESVGDDDARKLEDEKTRTEFRLMRLAAKMRDDK